MANRLIAVVTDAISQEYFFPVWYKYYGDLFGRENLFVLTYAGCSPPFREFPLGGLIELPRGYNEDLRRDVINGFIASLLPCYDVIIRADIDEFLVVDPAAAVSLAAYVQDFEGPHMTARGFDVTQMPDEPLLGENYDAPVLRDRAFATPNTALNKTCIVTTPLTWSLGFHWASVCPRFGPLFMLHLKRLDIGWQLGWQSRMYDNIKDNPNERQIMKDYYYPDAASIRDHHMSVSKRTRLTGIDAWYRLALTENFQSKIALANGLYCGEYGGEPVLCEIPPEWKCLL